MLVMQVFFSREMTGNEGGEIGKELYEGSPAGLKLWTLPSEHP